jgi:hypothetical protein
MQTAKTQYYLAVNRKIILYSIITYSKNLIIMINRGRMTAKIDGEFVVFIIGMRINNPLIINQWLPILTAMPKMIKELYSKPEHGFLHHEMWFSRTSLLIQYWRSLDHLLNYSNSPDGFHLPEWKKFIKNCEDKKSVGIWHETYIIRSSSYETIYINMPAYGLGKAGSLVKANGKLNTACSRIKNIGSVPD